jgi:hypothetical protein
VDLDLAPAPGPVPAALIQAIAPEIGLIMAMKTAQLSMEQLLVPTNMKKRLGLPF